MSYLPIARLDTRSTRARAPVRAPVNASPLCGAHGGPLVRISVPLAIGLAREELKDQPLGLLVAEMPDADPASPFRCLMAGVCTLREYGRSLRLRILPEFGALRLTELRRSDLQAFVDRELASGPSPSTIANALNPIQAIYRHAVRRELVGVNPTRDLELPAANGRRERIVSAKEAAVLIEAVRPSDRALWATAFYAGLRRGELRALRWSDVDLGRSEIRVERSWDDHEGAQDPKSEAGKRTVPILAVLRDYLDALKIDSGRGRDDLVFGRTASEPFSPSTVREGAGRAWKRAKLTAITLHECRHTFASLLIDAGVNAKAIQTFMGHATIEMTFGQYGHLMPGSREQARELVDAYLDAAEQEARTEALTAT